MSAYQAFAATESFHPLGNDEREALLAKTHETAANSLFDPFKTSSILDGTADNAQWLGEEPPEIRERRRERRMLMMLEWGSTRSEFVGDVCSFCYA
jgi:hypothetical protein